MLDTTLIIAAIAASLLWAAYKARKDGNQRDSVFMIAMSLLGFGSSAAVFGLAA